MDVQLSKSLSRDLAAANEYFFVGKRALQLQPYYFLLITQTTSKPSGDGGAACGAGTEDVLRLLEWLPKSHRLVQRDAMLIQSCLLSLSLNDDSGATLRTRLQGAIVSEKLPLTWLNHPKFGAATKEIAVRNNSLVIK